jgi:nitrogen regulatory protein PII 2
MKEIIAVVRMNKVGATKKALVEAGVAGFTAIKVMGRGKLVKDPSMIEERRKALLALTSEGDVRAEQMMIQFLDGTRFFPRRMFTILASDGDVPRIIEAVIAANRTDNKVGDGKIFVLPILDAARVRTGETGEAAIR